MKSRFIFNTEQLWFRPNYRLGIQRFLDFSFEVSDLNYFYIKSIQTPVIG